MNLSEKRSRICKEEVFCPIIAVASNTTISKATVGTLVQSVTTVKGFIVPQAASRKLITSLRFDNSNTLLKF